MGFFDRLKKVASYVVVKVHSKEQGGGGAVLIKTPSSAKEIEAQIEKEIKELDNAIEEWEKQCESNSKNN